MSTPIFLLALALAAEPAQPGNQAAPAPTEPAPAAAPAASTAEAPVLTLDQVLQLADENNYDLKVARERIVQVKEIRRKVLAAYLPQITVGGSYTRNQFDAKLSMPTGYWLRDMTGTPGFDRTKTNGPDFDPTKGMPSESNPPGTASNTIMMPSGMVDLTIQDKDQFGFQAKLQQGILLPALFPLFKAADLAEEATQSTIQGVRIDVLYGAMQFYYACVGLKEVIGVSERVLQNYREHEKDAQVRVEAGALPKIALIQAQIERSNAEQDLRQAKANYVSYKIALGTLVNHPEDFEVVHPAEPKDPGDPEELMKQATRDRVLLKTLRINHELAVKNHDAVWYKFAPSLLATAQYQATNSKGFTGEYGAWAVGLVLGWTVWDGGVRESELRENASKVVESELALKSAENSVRDEVRRAFLDLQTAQSNRVKADETLKLARENQALVTVNYQAGAATQLEVSDANKKLNSAEYNLVSQTLNAQLAAVKLVKAAGGFNPQFK
ncbi:MAG: TolC family protein [Myxococcales bacterium]